MQQNTRKDIKRTIVQKGGKQNVETADFLLLHKSATQRCKIEIVLPGSK